MATRRKKPGPKIDPKACQRVMFGLGHARRFTQDSPILPDVWMKFAEDLDEPRQLLLSPFGDWRPGEVRFLIAERLKTDHKRSGKPDRELIYNQSTVLAELDFEELVRVVLPVTDWWGRALTRRSPKPGEPELITLEELAGMQNKIAAALQDPEREASKLDIHLSADILWLIRTVGFLARAKQERRNRSLKDVEEIEKVRPRRAERQGSRVTKSNWLPEVKAVVKLFQNFDPPEPNGPRVWSVNLNRVATTTIYRSSVAVKGDAARRLFQISCKDLVWAVVDSGIDATHPAFRLRKDGEKSPPYEEPFEKVDGKWTNRTRVVATYDFRLIRDLLNPARLDPPSKDLPPRVRDLLQGKHNDKKLVDQLKQLKPRLISGNEIDWTLLEPLLEIPHDDRYTKEKWTLRKEGEDEREERIGHIPRNDHGTHCAGILAADWRDTDPGREKQPTMTGICPDLRLYDLRVFDDDGMGDEFSIIAALQYIRYKNAHKDYYVVHGTNLSMSIKHDVTNFACGRTPVCEEAERLVNNGVVVVAAAGNEGYAKYETTEGAATEGYRSISITDPGNADLVITVGATHRFKPHTYGVSYFSSRGPTGDGRIKPDIVAPGEKIESTTPNSDTARKDGTSMATPHVSGAAALLMARYEELVGKPGRIKQILTSTATDLGRERYFQGAGMVDVLRALQSV